MPRRTRGKASKTIVFAARENRRQLTPAEKELWEVLRDRRLAGLKFRIQHPLDHYVLDFYCVEQMLTIEVDGGIHQEAEQKNLDTERTMRLNELGVRVLRFTNEEIFADIDKVRSQILDFIRNNPKKPREHHLQNPIN